MSRERVVSVEIGHMYLDRMNEEAIDARAVAGQQQLLQSVAGRRSELPSLVVLIDDYNRYDDPWKPWTVHEAQQAVVDGFLRRGVTIDHVALESSLAESVDIMFDFLVPEPRRGEGSFGGSAEAPLWDSEGGWLSNGDPPRSLLSHEEGKTGALIDPLVFEVARPVFEEPRHRHRIALDVQLWSSQEGERLWACPALAAWWQLVRLGALDYVHGSAGTAPPGTWSRPEGPPFVAKETITYLPLQYLETEHAAWNILRQVVLPDTLAQSLRLSGGPLPVRGHLDRISYVFSPGMSDLP